MKKDNEYMELPDILEFLSLCRKLIVQITLLKKIDIPEQYRKQIIGAIENINDSACCYLNEKID